MGKEREISGKRVGKKWKIPELNAGTLRQMVPLGGKSVVKLGNSGEFWGLPAGKSGQGMEKKWDTGGKNRFLGWKNLR